MVNKQEIEEINARISEETNEDVKNGLIVILSHLKDLSYLGLKAKFPNLPNKELVENFNRQKELAMDL